MLNFMLTLAPEPPTFKSTVGIDLYNAPLAEIIGGLAMSSVDSAPSSAHTINWALRPLIPSEKSKKLNPSGYPEPPFVTFTIIL